MIIGGMIYAKKHKTNVTNAIPDTHGVNSNKSILSDFNSVYNTANISDLDDRPIEINNLLVRKVFNDKVFAVSSDEKNPILMYVFQEPSTDPNKPYLALHPGERVNIQATLHRSPSLDDLKNTWGLKESDANDVINRLIYAIATSVTPTPVAPK